MGGKFVLLLCNSCSNMFAFFPNCFFIHHSSDKEVEVDDFVVVVVWEKEGEGGGREKRMIN